MRVVAKTFSNIRQVLVTIKFGPGECSGAVILAWSQARGLYLCHETLDLVIEKYRIDFGEFLSKPFVIAEAPMFHYDGTNIVSQIDSQAVVIKAYLDQCIFPDPATAKSGTIDTVLCRQCHASLSKGPMISKALPSEYWMDIVDCWSCHNNEFSHRFGNIYQPNPTALLFGSGYVIIDQDMVQNVHRHQDVVHCQTCMLYLGSKFQNGHKLSRYSIHIQGLENTDQLLLGNQLLEKIEANATYRFVLESLSQKMWIWVIHPTFFLRVSDTEKYKRAMSLWYSTSPARDWDEIGSERLEFSQANIEQFQRLLDTNSETAGGFQGPDTFSESFLYLE